MTPLAAEIPFRQRWHDLWASEAGEWLIGKGLRIVLLLIGAVLASRFITWAARRVTRRLELGFAASDALVRSEASKHRQAVASVISWVSVVLLCVVVAVQITGILFQLPSGLANGGLFTFVQQQESGSSTNESYLSGFQTALQLISVSIGLTVGLGISLVLVHPIPSRRRAAGLFTL